MHPAGFGRLRHHVYPGRRAGRQPNLPKPPVSPSPESSSTGSRHRRHRIREHAPEYARVEPLVTVSRSDRARRVYRDEGRRRDVVERRWRGTARSLARESTQRRPGVLRVLVPEYSAGQGSTPRPDLLRRVRFASVPPERLAGAGHPTRAVAHRSAGLKQLNPAVAQTDRCPPVTWCGDRPERRRKQRMRLRCPLRNG
jgi:hypothetical protein